MYSRLKCTSLFYKLSQPHYSTGKGVTKPLKGTHDLFGENMDTYRYLIESAKSTFNLYGFNEVSRKEGTTDIQIATPLIEESSLFLRSLGNDSDVVNKEMYTFPTKSNTGSISLRPENTAGTIPEITAQTLRCNASCVVQLLAMFCFFTTAPLLPWPHVQI